jgi:hypothetical protein
MLGCWDAGMLGCWDETKRTTSTEMVRRNWRGKSLGRHRLSPLTIECCTRVGRHIWLYEAPGTWEPLAPAGRIGRPTGSKRVARLDAFTVRPCRPGQARIISGLVAFAEALAELPSGQFHG